MCNHLGGAEVGLGPEIRAGLKSSEIKNIIYIGVYVDASYVCG